MMHQDSLKPSAIRFTLERLQESARRSGYILLKSQQNQTLASNTLVV